MQRAARCSSGGAAEDASYVAGNSIMLREGPGGAGAPGCPGRGPRAAAAHFSGRWTASEGCPRGSRGILRLRAPSQGSAAFRDPHKPYSRPPAAPLPSHGPFSISGSGFRVFASFTLTPSTNIDLGFSPRPTARLLSRGSGTPVGGLPEPSQPPPRCRLRAAPRMLRGTGGLSGELYRQDNNNNKRHIWLK